MKARSAICCFALTLAAGLAAIAAAQENTAQDNTARGSSIKQLILGLGASTSAKRQEAFRALIELGPLAIGELSNAIETSDTPQKMRCMSVLHRMAISRDTDLAGHATEAIEKLAESEDREASAWAIQILSRLQSSIQENAIRELLALNARFSAGTTIERIQQVERQDIYIGREWKGNLDDLRQLLWLAEITKLNVVGEHIDDEAIQTIAKLPMLLSLRIKDATITNAAIKSLSAMESLKTLEVVYCEIDDACLDDLVSTPALTFFKSYGTNITSQGILDAQKKKEFTVDFRLGAFLGVNYAPSEGPGCNITTVVPGAAASLAGIRAGDTIVHYGDKPINVAEDFQDTVSNNRAGDEVPIVVERDGKRLTFSVVLGPFPDRQ